MISKETLIFPNIHMDPYSFVSPSAYDTAWLAMIPHDDHTQDSSSSSNSKPMFESCLKWVLNNQNEQGFWGTECDGHGMPTIECLPSTLACILALKRWNVGTPMIHKGLDYLNSNAEKLIQEMCKDVYNCPRWFTIVFPAMVEIAEGVGLKIEFKQVVSQISHYQQKILETEKLIDDKNYPPLLSYYEALPLSYDIKQEYVIDQLKEDGSLFQSPSATAKAFMVTGSKICLEYLQKLVQRRANIGVPTTYSMDEDLIKLCIVDHIQRLGLEEHFILDIDQVLEQIYKNYKNEDDWTKPSNSVAIQLQKESLAFRLLRMHGYYVSPWRISGILCQEENRCVIEKNPEYFSSVMLNVYRSTDLMFAGEYELEEARSFSKKILEKSISLEVGVYNPFRPMIERELSVPWIARLDHLDHRFRIENNEMNSLWRGKLFFQRLTGFHNDKLLHLAIHNYNLRQSTYKNELDQLTRWSKETGLSDMGFGREKTTYLYFAVAASSSLPLDSDIRMIIAKSGLLITVADDFFDIKGSPTELNTLTDAIKRWDAKGLSGHGKIIFNALDDLVSEMSKKYLKQQGNDITNHLRDIWYETFDSWLTESEWSRTDFIPSVDAYLKVGMKSIAAHTLVLPASCLVQPSLQISKLRPPEYEPLTKLLMVVTRLLNDIESHQKEREEISTNFLLLHLRKNPDADMDESIAYVGEILTKKKQELIEHALMDGSDDFPKPCKLLHLSCFKVFQMFYNTSNRFDSETDLLGDISKAIYIPLQVQSPKCLLKSLPLPSISRTKSHRITSYKHFGWPTKCYANRSLFVQQLSGTTLSSNGYSKITFPTKSNFCFV